jgi:putative ABC transport system substrate-binding protein
LLGAVPSSFKRDEHLIVDIVFRETAEVLSVFLRIRENVRQAIKDVRLQPVDVRDPNEFKSAFSAMTREHAGALMLLADSMFRAYRARIVELAGRSRLPSIFWTRDSVEAGGLMSYGATYADLYRRVAYYVDKILKGAKPADLPVEQPIKFEFIINLKTAKQIGLTIPPNVLTRADKVIREASAKAGGR